MTGKFDLDFSGMDFGFSGMDFNVDSSSSDSSAPQTEEDQESSEHRLAMAKKRAISSGSRSVDRILKMAKVETNDGQVHLSLNGLRLTEGQAVWPTHYASRTEWKFQLKPYQMAYVHDGLNTVRVDRVGTHKTQTIADVCFCFVFRF